jgi:hypothetical protein
VGHLAGLLITLQTLVSKVIRGAFASVMGKFRETPFWWRSGRPDLPTLNLPQLHNFPAENQVCSVQWKGVSPCSRLPLPPPVQGPGATRGGA